MSPVRVEKIEPLGRTRQGDVELSAVEALLLPPLAWFIEKGLFALLVVEILDSKNNHDFSLQPLGIAKIDDDDGLALLILTDSTCDSDALQGRPSGLCPFW